MISRNSNIGDETGNPSSHNVFPFVPSCDRRGDGTTTAAVHRKSALEHVQDIVLDRDVDSVLEKLFHIKARGTTWEMECFCGFVQFVSCMYVLPVVPAQLSRAGFDDTKTVVVTVCSRVMSCPTF